MYLGRPSQEKVRPIFQIFCQFLRSVIKFGLSREGLFAARDYEKDEVVTLYMGDVIPRDSVPTLKDPSYVMHLGYHEAIDGRTGWQGLQGLGRFVNCPPVGEKHNVRTGKVVEENGTKAIKLIASRKISRGEEFFIRYGKLS